MRVCAHCGEMYPKKRLNCPHCGADADHTYADDSYSPDFELDTGELDYDRYLEREGFAPRAESWSMPWTWLLVGVVILIVLVWRLL